MTAASHEPNHRNYGVYEQQPATAMLASACVYCGKALQQPHSIEQGCGDICAKKYGVFTPTESANWGNLDKALETAPEPLRKAVEAKVRDEALEALGGAGADLEGAMKRVNHIVGHRWETGAADAKEYIGAAIEIANALGFTLVANKLTERFIEGKDKDVRGGFKIVSVDGDMWEIDLGYLDRAVWWDTVKAMEHAGARRIGRRNVFDFPPHRWIHVLNVLTRNFSGELGLLPSGETFIVPEQPLPTPAPETEPAGAPDAVTDERPKLPELKKGQVLELRDGSEVVVGWVGPDRVGVMPLSRAQEALERFGRITPGRAGYEFIGTEAVALVKADKVDVERVENATGGEQPSESKWVPVDREYPEKLYSYQRESALWCDTVGSGVLALDMGLGKCQHYDALVYTADGPRKLGAIWDETDGLTRIDADGGEWKKAPADILVQSFNEEANAVELRAAQAVYRERVRTELCRIQLDDGSVIICTQPHRVYTAKGWVRAAELREKDRVAVAARIPPTFECEMSSAAAELTAWQLAEGHESGKYNWVFTNKDEDVLARVARHARTLGVQLPAPRKDKGRTTHTLGTTRLRHVIAPDFPAGTRSAERYVPPSILRANEEAQAAFLAAFCEAEGAVCFNGVLEVTSASDQLMSELKWMLLRWGIWLRVKPKRARATNSRTPTWRTYYRGQISGNSLVRFAEHIGLISTRKRAKLARCVALKRNTNTEGIPTQAVVQEALASGLRQKDLGIGSVYVRQQGMSRAGAAAFSSRLRELGRPQLAQRVDGLRTDAVHWTRVKSVERVRHDGYVYDLTIPGTENYIADGVVCHNTAVSTSCADPPVVVICPASLRINWVREVNMWRPDLTATSVGIAEKIVKGRKVTKKTKSAITDEQLEADVVVINYDILGPENVAALKERGIKTLIVDEAHYIKEVRKSPRKPAKGSKRAVAVLELAEVAERRLMLTGTPMINGRPYELWPLLHAVAPEQWPSFFSYCKRYCAPEKKSFQGRQFTDYTGKANLDELREKTQGKFLLRKTKDELDLPEKARRSIELVLSTGSKKKDLASEPELYEAVAKNWAREYDAAAREFIEWVRRNGGPQKAMRAKRAEALAKMTALRRLSAMGKIDAMVDQCVGHLTSTGRPLVVMGHHKAPRQLLARALELSGVRVGLYPEDGQRAIDAFQRGEPPDAPEEQREYLDVIICSIQAAGVGLTLTRASDMFFIERAWRAFDLVQAEDRAHRIGQTNAVTITYYDAAGTIDMKIREMLVDKAATALQVIDGVDTATDDAAAELVLGSMFGRDGEMQPNASDDQEMFGFEWAGAEL